MVGTQTHGGVDGFHGADTFVQRVDRLVDHRDEDTVHDESRIILGIGRCLVETLGESDRRFVRVLAGRKAADDFHQLHQWHRVHEVHADELVGPVGDRSQARDRDGGRVGREIGVRRYDFADRAEDLFFDFALLSCCLDHDVGRFERLDGGGRLDALETCLHGLVGDHAAQDLTMHIAFDRAHTLGERIIGNIGHDDVIACQRRDMGNAIAHLARADHAYCLQFCHVSGILKEPKAMCLALILFVQCVKDQPLINRIRCAGPRLWRTGHRAGRRQPSKKSPARAPGLKRLGGNAVTRGRRSVPAPR